MATENKTQVRPYKVAISINLYQKTFDDIERLAMEEQRSRSKMADILLQEALAARGSRNGSLAAVDVADPWSALERQSDE